MTRTALIIGVTGQDGGALARFLLGKGYLVHGMSRRILPEKSNYIATIAGPEPERIKRLNLINGDVTDVSAVERIVLQTKPDEIYNFAAQSDVAESFRRPIDTIRINAEGPVNLLEILRTIDEERRVRLYQASSSELFGSGGEAHQTETSPFNPQSPYGISKHLAHMMCVHYRNTYGIKVSNGITYNHEGPFRGQNFVTRKITLAAAAIGKGRQDILRLGNLNAARDWGHVDDYVEGMWRMLQHEEADDFILATGEVHTVREFAELAFQCVGIDLDWEGEGVEETGRDRATGKIRVAVDEDFFRPTSPGHLVGDAGKAHRLLGWQPKISFREIIAQMVEADLARLSRHPVQP